MAWFGTVTKVEEGFDGPSDQDIPIDIHFNKLLEFLVDRKKVVKNWKNTQNQIKSKINKLFREIKKLSLPLLPDNISLILSYEIITYWDFQIVQQYLCKLSNDKGCSKEQKQQLNQLLNQASEIEQKYQSDNVYLADSASIMNNWVSYEIPAIRKSSEKFEKQIHEINKKISEHTKQFTIYDDRFKSDCKMWGIEGKNIRDELSGLTSELPHLFKKIEEKIMGEEIGQMIKYYHDFVNNNKNTHCKILNFIHQNGNIRVAEMNYRMDPTNNPNPDLLFKDDSIEQQQKQVEIDWDIPFDLTSTSPSTEISSPNTSLSKASGWEITVEEEGQLRNQTNNVSEVKSETDSTETDLINWNIVPENLSEISFDIDFGPLSSATIDSTGSVPKESKVSKKKEREMEQERIRKQRLRESVLESLDTRGLVWNDLLEIQSFFQIRFQEMSGSTQLLLLDTVSNRNQSTFDLSTCEKWLNFLRVLIDEFSEGRIKQLIEIKNSSRFLDRVAAGIRRKYELSTKMNSSIIELESRKEQLETSIHHSSPELHLIISRVKDLQTQISKDMSKLYNGRIVNIIGEINNL